MIIPITENATNCNLFAFFFFLLRNLALIIAKMIRYLIASFTQRTIGSLFFENARSFDVLKIFLDLSEFFEAHCLNRFLQFFLYTIQSNLVLRFRFVQLPFFVFPRARKVCLNRVILILVQHSLQKFAKNRYFVKNLNFL